MGVDTNSIIECYSCGLFLRKKKIAQNKKAKCPRCNSRVLVDEKHSFDSLIYAISALLLFAVLNIYPLVSLSINEMQLKATLYNTVLILFEQNFFVVGMIVFFTIIVAPVLNSIVIILSFIQMHTRIKIFTDTLLHDAFHFFKTWGFVEVFVISIIVTYIKLVGMEGSTKFDYGFYAMLAYTFCFYLSNTKFEGKNVFGE